LKSGNAKNVDKHSSTGEIEWSIATVEDLRQTMVPLSGHVVHVVDLLCACCSSSLAGENNIIIFSAHEKLRAFCRECLKVAIRKTMEGT